MKRWIIILIITASGGLGFLPDCNSPAWFAMDEKKASNPIFIEFTGLYWTSLYCILVREGESKIFLEAAPDTGMGKGVLCSVP